MRALTLLPLLTLSLCAQTNLPVEALIARVRVHPDEAWVTRTAHVQLPHRGVYLLELDGLQNDLNLDDLKVTAKAPEGSWIGDISIGPSPASVAVAKSGSDSDPETTSWQRRREALEARQESLKDELGFLRKAMDAQAEGTKERSNAGSSGLMAILDQGRGFQVQLEALLLEQKKVVAELVKLEHEKKVKTQTAPNGLEGYSRIKTKLQVELNVADGGPVDLTIQNRTSRARWQPDYEARLSEDGKSVELVLFGKVSQNTAEDWTQVPLELSTTRLRRKSTPAGYRDAVYLGWSGEAVPEAVPLNAQRELPRNDLSMRYAGAGEAGQSAAVVTVEAVAQAPVREAAPAVIQEPRGMGKSYLLEGPRSIPADGQLHRFRVTALDEKTDLILVASPRLDPTVYQVAQFQVPGEFPLFPGAPLHPFLGGQRMPPTTVDLSRPGRPFQIVLGPVDGVRVVHEKLSESNPYRLVKTVTRSTRTADGKREEVTGKVVTTGPDRVWTLSERFRVTNGLSVPYKIQLLDREVRSNQERVEVSCAASVPADGEPPASFLRSWTFTLQPEGKTDLQLDWKVKGPKEGFMLGLEGMGFSKD